jgi:hypothetical protein
MPTGSGLGGFGAVQMKRGSWPAAAGSPAAARRRSGRKGGRRTAIRQRNAGFTDSGRLTP